MPLTVYLSKVIGNALIIVGAVIAVRWRYYIPVFATYPEQRLVRVVTSLGELVAGLLLILAHNVWSPLPAAIVSLIGWLMLGEALLYLCLPEEWVKRFIDTFNTRTWYLVGGVAAIVAGGYLAGYGFGVW